MAKPKHGRQYNYDPPFPSQAALAAIALIAATPSVVAGSPLPTSPPEFLCPSIQRDTVHPPSTSTSSAAPTSSTVYQAVADRYAEGPDSRWRKLSSWTLYGSTCCSGSLTATSSTHPHPSQTPTYTPTTTSTSTSATATATMAFDVSTLPAGWNSANNTPSTASTTILALAIALAGSICVFILGCLVWRRRRRRAKDVERKLGHKHTIKKDSSGDLLEKDTRGKMRMWARASARWKSNIRQSVRRRRKRPLASSAANRPQSQTFDDSRISIDASSPPSRRSSLSSEEPDPLPATGLRADNSSTSQADTHDPRPPSPPTYGASFVPRFANVPPTSTTCDPSSPPLPDRPQSAQPSNQPSVIDDEPLPYVPRSDGHVAMDDKSHLARIRELASSPPAAGESTTQHISAPEWHDVEDNLQSLGVDLSEVSMAVADFGFPPFFPPPPKAGPSLGYLDGHSLPYGTSDHILLPPVPGPSGSPSAPPIDYPSLEPSAPCLEDDDDLFRDWDMAASYAPNVPTLANQGSAPASATDPSTSSDVPFSSHPPVRQAATRNSILPQYHP